jgi:hypothetical protein
MVIPLGENMQEEFSFEFDKFMNDIVDREPAANQVPQPSDDLTPQREYIKRYRELPQNRTRWSR